MFIPRKSVVTFAVLFAASVVTAQSNCDRFYIVQPDEDCNSISAAQNVSTYQLATVNAGVINSFCSNLFVGEDLCLGIAGQDCQTTYVVQSLDSCATIAAKAGIPVSTLLANNPNINADCTNIYIDEVLCTASEIYVYTTTSESPTTTSTIVQQTTSVRITMASTTSALPSPVTSTVVSSTPSSVVSSIPSSVASSAPSSVASSAPSTVITATQVTSIA